MTVKPYEQWVHLWQGSPVYRELKAGWPIGWVIEDGAGKIAGSMGNVPTLCELDGKSNRRAFFFAPFDVDAALGFIHQIDHIWAIHGVHRDAFATGDVADY